MIKFSLLLFCFLLFVSPCHAWQARVVTVTDGDTITVEPLAGGQSVKIRLHGIDAPERKQPAGESARGFVFDVALYQVVEVEEKDRDRYGRVVAVIRLPSSESLQELLLKSGFAWVWPQYCRNCQNWEKLQTEAQKNGCGLWANPDPIPPWEWRRGTRP